MRGETPRQTRRSDGGGEAYGILRSRPRMRSGHCLNKQRIVSPQFRLTGALRPYDPAERDEGIEPEKNM